MGTRPAVLLCVCCVAAVYNNRMDINTILSPEIRWYSLFEGSGKAGSRDRTADSPPERGWCVPRSHIRTWPRSTTLFPTLFLRVTESKTLVNYYSHYPEQNDKENSHVHSVQELTPVHVDSCSFVHLTWKLLKHHLFLQIFFQFLWSLSSVTTALFTSFRLHKSRPSWMAIYPPATNTCTNTLHAWQRGQKTDVK